MSRPPLPDPCLCAITDRARLRAGADLAETVAAAVRGGANMAQLRDKGAPPRETLALARRLRAATRGRALLIIPGRADLAALSEADGVQLGENSIDVASARRLLGDGALIGRSVHSEEGALRAQDAGADYLILGTIFATPSHPGGATGGLELMRRVADRADIPILGIGGVDADNAADIIRAGAGGAAVISAVIAAKNPADAATRLIATMRQARGETAGAAKNTEKAKR